MNHRVFSIWSILISLFIGVPPYRQGRHVMAGSKIKAGEENNEVEGKVKREPKKAKKKRADNQKMSMKVGDISQVSGKVQVAGGDIVTHEHFEEATAARTEKEFEIKELEELRVSILEKFESFNNQRAARLETGKIFHPNALELNEGSYLLGRGEYLDQLTRRVVSEQTVFMSGNGGVGRTSLLQAGLMPYLLEQGHLPVFVSVSQEPLALSIKRNLLTGVYTTTYLKRLELAEFLEQATKFLPKNKQLVLLIDDFEKLFEKGEEKGFYDLEKEWGYTKTNLQLRWLFSIDRGFTARLAPFRPEDILEVPPLDHSTARQALRALGQGGRTLEAAYLEEIVNELGSHRESIKGASINPSELQVVLRVLAESESSQPLSKIYEEKERVSGIFEDYLVGVINNTFIPARRPVVWQILTFLKEEYGTPVSTAWIESKLSTYGFETKEVPELLQRLRKQHVIRAKEESYELAHVNLMRGIQKRLREQTLLKNARDEYRRQLDNIRASALRGMLAGGVGFVVFRWLVGGLVRNPLDLVFLTLLYASIGGMTGLLLTFSTDMFIARYRGRPAWQRYLLGTATGLVMFGLALALYVYQREHIGNNLMPVGLAAIVGGAWGGVAGAGIAWAIGPARVQLWKILLTAAASGFTLLLSNQLLPVIQRSTSLQLLLGGFFLPLILLAGVLFWKRVDPE
jgi:hypothetical protein